MPNLTAPRASVAAALLAVFAGTLAPNPLIAFYLTAVALAGLLGASFLAYLEVIDQPSRSNLALLVACCAASLLVMVDATVRFPTVIAGTSSGTGILSLAALAVVAAGSLAPLVRRVRLAQRMTGGHLQPLRGLLER
jgi:hypothetical protein